MIKKINPAKNERGCKQTVYFTGSPHLEFLQDVEI